MKGSCSIRCLHGQIRINGRLIDVTSAPIDLLSEEHSSLLCIEDTGFNKIDEEMLGSLVSKIKEANDCLLSSAMENDLKAYMEDLEGEIGSCVLMKKTHPPLFDVLKQLNDYKPTQDLQVSHFFECEELRGSCSR